jgi:hypothetical protein
VRALAACVCVVALVVGATASSASAAPSFSSADRKEIGVLLDAFVKDAVRREDLAAAWQLTGPDLRSGTTRAAWVSGRGVTVQAFPVRGTDFRGAWTGKLVEPGHAILSMVLQLKPNASGTRAVSEEIDVRRIHGRWLVDNFYPAALMKGPGQIVGPHDFGPGAGPQQPSDAGRISGEWLLVVLGALVGLVVAVPLGLWVHLKLRDRRARRAFELGS